MSISANIKELEKWADERKFMMTLVYTPKGGWRMRIGDLKPYYDSDLSSLTARYIEYTMSVTKPTKRDKSGHMPR
jgi:hypothetical protein